jgi:hypothetical protein
LRIPVCFGWNYVTCICIFTHGLLTWTVYRLLTYTVCVEYGARS